jgi:hypothetical protein
MTRDDRTNRQAGGDIHPLLVIVHRDRFPWTILNTKRTADAPVQIHLDDFQQIGVIRSRHHFDAIRWADDNTGFTSRTSLLIDDCSCAEMISGSIHLAAALRSDLGENLMTNLLIINLPF